MDTFLVDLDDVVHPFHDPLFALHVERELGVPYPYESHAAHLAEAMPGVVTVEQELRIVHMVYDDPTFWELDPIDGAVEALASLSLHYKVVGATTRPAFTSERTIDYLERNFRQTFSDVIHVGLRDTDEYKITKVEHAIRLNAKAMMDDTRYNLAGCNAHGVQGILLDHPWNRADTPHDDFVRVYNWQEVPTLLISLAA